MALTPASSRGWLRSATLALSDAQIRALPTTPLTVVPAPAPGQLIAPVYAILRVDTTGGVYTDITVQNSMIYLDWELLGTPAFYLAVNDLTLTQVTDLLTAEMDAFVMGARGQISAGGSFAGTFAERVTTNAGTALRLASNNGIAFGGGHPANSGRLSVMYVVWDSATGAFV